MGRRVLITGVSGYWGTELARRLERSPEVEYIAGLDVRPPAADLERTEFIRADIRNPLISKLLPQTEVDTVVHCDVLLAPEPGKAPRAAPRHQRDRLAPAARGVREDGDRAHDRRARLGRDLRRRAERARVLHRGHGAALPAAHALPARRRRARELLRELSRAAIREVTVTMLRYQPTLGADDRLAAHALPAASRSSRCSSGFDPLLQFVHAEDAVGALEAAVRAAGARARERRRRGQHLAQPPAAPGGQGAAAGPGAAVRRRARRGRPARASRGCRRRRCRGCATALTIDCTRLIEEVGFRPRSTLEAVEDFVEELRGRRVLPGPARPRRRQSRRATARAGPHGRARDADRHAAQRERARRLRIDVERASRRAAAPRGRRSRAARRRRPSPMPRARRSTSSRCCASATRQGSDLPGALERRPVALPGSARDIADRAARRLRGDYAQDEWGFDEEFVEIVYPLFEFMYERWWRVTATGVDERARRTTARCSSPTTPACCRGTRR